MKFRIFNFAVILSLAAAAIVGCKKDNPGTENEVPSDLTPFVMTYEDFITPDDVQIVSPDTVSISVSSTYADKMGIKDFKGRAVTIWRTIGTIPFIRIIEDAKVEGDKIMLTTARGEFSDMFVDLDVMMETDLYVNRDYVPTKATRAGTNVDVTDNSGKYTDTEGVIHPAVIILDQDSPIAKSIMTRAGEQKTYFTAEELLEDNLSFEIININSAFKFDYQYPEDDDDDDDEGKDDDEDDGFEESFGMHIKGKVGVAAELSAYANVSVGFMKLKKFEVGIKGSAELSAKTSVGIEYNVKKEWENTLAKLGTTTMVFWVGVVPVPFTIESELKQNTAAEATASVEILASAKYSAQFEAGCGYKDGKWGANSKAEQKEKSFTFDGVRGAAEMEASTGVFFETGIFIGGSAGPTLSFGPNVSAEAEVAAEVSMDETVISASCAAYAGLAAEMGAKVKILGYTLAKWQTTVDILKFTLFEGSLSWTFNDEEWGTLVAEWTDILDSEEWDESDTKTPIPYRLPDQEMNL